MSKKVWIQVKIGAFIFSGLVLLGSYLVVIGNYQSLFARANDYTVLITNAKGLFKGTPVTINGLKAGRVHQIHLQDNQIVINMKIEKKLSHMINSTSKASLKTEGLVGDRYVAIDTLDSQAEPLPAGSNIPLEEDTGVSNVFSGDSELIVGVTQFFKEASALLENLNESEDENLAESLKEISKQTKKFLSDDKNKDIKYILRHTRSILRKIDKGQGSLGALVNERSLHNRAVTFLGGKPYKMFLDNIFGGSKKESDEDE
ncbi:MAG: MlaD family protein [Bdellovibrionales bacterium]|nr:MlaD family protein [Bdellovibrionales bacterium]